MSPAFFDRPILNSPYDYPERHWELDESGQPTDRVIDRRRPAQYVSPTGRDRFGSSVGREGDKLAPAVSRLAETL